MKKLLRAGMMPARTWEVHAAGMAPTERLKLRTQMAAAAGKTSTTSRSLFMEAWPLNTGQKEYGQENGFVSKKKLGWGRFARFKRVNR